MAEFVIKNKGCVYVLRRNKQSGVVLMWQGAQCRPAIVFQ